MDPYKSLRKKMMDPAGRITKNFRSYIGLNMKKTAIYTPGTYLILPKILVNLVLKYGKPIDDVWYSGNGINEFYYIKEGEITTKKLNVFKTKEDAEKERDKAEALEKYKDMKIELAEVKKERDEIKKEKEQIEHLQQENERLRQENEELRNLPPVKVETLKPGKLCQCINKIDDTFKYGNR